MVNSAGTGMRGEIFSVDKALLVVGEERFRRVATLAVAAALTTGRTREALRLALARARFCELGAGLTGRPVTEQYLLGLFSLLPAMLQMQMEDAIEAIAPRAEIRAALMGECNEDSRLLRWVEFYMRGEWLRCDEIALELGVAASQLRQCAMDAMSWADTNLHALK
jgi:EAL and modified HD-GYP domain-containing signal transduction protein